MWGKVGLGVYAIPNAVYPLRNCPPYSNHRNFKYSPDLILESISLANLESTDLTMSRKDNRENCWTSLTVQPKALAIRIYMNTPIS